MSDPPLTSPSLLFRLRDSGDELAWVEFVEIYTPLIHRLRAGPDCRMPIWQTWFKRYSAPWLERSSGTIPTRRRARFGVGCRASRETRSSIRWRVFAGIRKALAARTSFACWMHIPPPRKRTPKFMNSSTSDGFLRGRPSACGSRSRRCRGRRSGWPGWKAEDAKDVAETLGTTIGTVYHCKSQVMTRLRRLILQAEGKSAWEPGDNE